MENIPVTSQAKVTLTAGSAQDRESIYKMRHDIYANELSQHTLNDNGRLSDELDLSNYYIVAKHNNLLRGFISITTPASKKYSVDKYFNRAAVPYAFDENLYEIRLLSVDKTRRNSALALVLMYAAFRWVQSHGGKNIVAICRTDLLEMYCKAGLKPLGIRASSGKLDYELSVASVDDLQKMAEVKKQEFTFLKNKFEWRLPFSFFAPSSCYHGGSFFKAIGEDLQTLEKSKQVINADVLDAWFPPSPNILKALHDNLSWLLQTSPPTHAEGLIKVIAHARGVKEQHILPGAGSSDLIFLSFKSLLDKTSRVLIIDPCYGEYTHVLEKVVQCHVTRFPLYREEAFVVHTARLLYEIETGYDMVVIVNPNSPTGVYIPRRQMEELLKEVPATTLVWVDETYIEYAGENESLEQFSVTRENVIVCKSMSKVYALSGARVAYLCCTAHLLETLRSLTPPWAVGLPAQLAAIEALKSPAYYREQYTCTHVLRANFKNDLLRLGITEVINGVANFLLFYLPENFAPADVFLKYCRAENLFLRDVNNMGKNLGNAIRVAIKDERTNKRIITIIEKVMKETIRTSLL